MVLDGGPSRVGVESTIVDCSGDEPAILRVGGIARERVEEIAGRAVAIRDQGEVRASGTLVSHYAPRASVVVVAGDDAVAHLVHVARAELATGARVGVIMVHPHGDHPAELPADVVVLGVARDADEYAHDLYRWLRAGDAAAVDVVVAMSPDEVGIGAAVADRLRRAAGGRTDDGDRA
jgi:L-threonylcarbamoyladenylate synthase